MNSKAIKWSVGFAVAIVAASALYISLRSNPRDTFEHLVAKPIPGSVNSIQEGGFRAMDSVLKVLEFNIAAVDMQKILDSKGYKLVGQSELDARTTKDYLKFWEEKIYGLAGVQVHIGDDWRAYAIKDPPNGQRYIFCSTNFTKAVFVADAH